jgi:DNA-binding transcriptional LysR family regulator
MDRIADFQAFVAVVERGSLTGAARQLGRSLQSVSRSLAAVEREVGIELVRRTTRRSNPTEAGLAFYRRLNAALTEIEAAKTEASNRRSEPSGLLRLTGSSAFAPLYLVPAIAAFLEAHPKVSVELDLSDRYVDLVDEGFDLAIRIFASPKYLATHGRPNRPDDLVHHRCIVRTAAREGETWPFGVGPRAETVKVAGRFRTSGAIAANEAAVQGLGIANAPLWQVRTLVDQGKLELTLTRFEPPPVPIHVVWAATNVPAAKTQLFADFLAARLKAAHL